MISFDEMHSRCAALADRLEKCAVDPEILADVERLRQDAATLSAAERGPENKRPLPECLFDMFRRALREHGIRSGVIAEIGGSKNSLMHRLHNFEVRFLSIFPSDDPRYLVADITNCPHISENSFDAIYSISVLEHVTRIHDAGREIVRLLKPGGITAHAVPFSYFFHGAPVDYWRVTTTALESLFEELATIKCAFFSDNRRRNNLGSVINRVDKDGGLQFSPDAFGGWRENWFTIYIGRKLPDGAERLREHRTQQTLVDLVKGLVEKGLGEDEAIDRALKAMSHISFNDYGRVLISTAPSARPLPVPSRDRLKEIWTRRSKTTIRPGRGYYNLMAMLAAAGVVE